MNRTRFALAGVCLLACALAYGQTQPSVVSAAHDLLSKSAFSLGGGMTPITGIRATGAALYTSGSDQQSAPITLQASGPRHSDILLSLAGGVMHQVRNGDAGSWSGPDGQTHPISNHNTWTTAAWFAPVLAVQEWLTDTGLVLDSVTPEERDGVAVQHIECHRELSADMSQATHDAIAAASRMDLFLDATTYLPLALEFNLHPDDNEARNIPVRIEYAQYKPEHGIQTPSRIREYLNGSLYLDITVENVVVDSTAAPEVN